MTNNSRGKVKSLHCLFFIIILISLLLQFQLILCIYSPSLISPGKMHISPDPHIRHLATGTRFNTRFNTRLTINNSFQIFLISIMAQLFVLMMAPLFSNSPAHAAHTSSTNATTVNEDSGAQKKKNR